VWFALLTSNLNLLKSVKYWYLMIAISARFLLCMMCYFNCVFSDCHNHKKHILSNSTSNDTNSFIRLSSENQKKIKQDKQMFINSVHDTTLLFNSKQKTVEFFNILISRSNVFRRLQCRNCCKEHGKHIWEIVIESWPATVRDTRTFSESLYLKNSSNKRHRFRFCKDINISIYLE
jgi:hypothetical protein